MMVRASLILITLTVLLLALASPAWAAPIMNPPRRLTASTTYVSFLSVLAICIGCLLSREKTGCP
jgi:hypothetical protein